MKVSLGLRIGFVIGLVLGVSIGVSSAKAEEQKLHKEPPVQVSDATFIVIVHDNSRNVTCYVAEAKYGVANTAGISCVKD